MFTPFTLAYYRKGPIKRYFVSCENKRKKDRDGQVELEEKNNASHYCHELEYIMKDEVYEQNTGEDDEKNETVIVSLTQKSRFQYIAIPITQLVFGNPPAYNYSLIRKLQGQKIPKKTPYLIARYIFGQRIILYARLCGISKGIYAISPSYCILYHITPI